MAKNDYRYTLLQEHLKEMRSAARLTQMQLASKLGKPQSFVSKIENGARQVNAVELTELCVACKVDSMKFMKKWLAAVAAADQ